jgi:predicted metalloprotease
MMPSQPQAPFPQNGQFSYTPQKKKSGGAALTISLVAVGAVILGVVGVAALGSTKHRVADTGYTYTPTSSTYTYSSDPNTPYNNATPPVSYTNTYTTNQDTTPTENDTTPTQEPAGPQPVFKMVDNPIFSQSSGLKHKGCLLPTWHSDPASAKTYFQTALGCLRNEWKPILDEYNLPFVEPILQVPATGGGSTRCSNDSSDSHEFAAYYCPDDNNLVMPYQSIQVDQFGKHPGDFLALIAHEYGHHIQTMSGIMGAYHKLADASANAKSLELNRRLELEAQCFGGLFMNYVNKSDGGKTSVTSTMQNDAYNNQDRGDHGKPPYTHGTDAHAVAWWRLGYSTGEIQQCDTWAASSADVA